MRGKSATTYFAAIKIFIISFSFDFIPWFSLKFKTFILSFLSLTKITKETSIEIVSILVAVFIVAWLSSFVSRLCRVTKEHDKA